jgi:hypothetical protein
MKVVSMRPRQFKTLVVRECKGINLKFFVRVSNEGLILFTEFSTSSPSEN